VRRIPLKSGGSILIVPSLEECPEGECCFTEAEYQHAKRISAGYANDPEAQKEFWLGSIEMKRVNSSYSIFESFPIEQEEQKKKTIAQTYCEKIKEQLLRGKREA
jgi:uncharacterized membrane protein